MARLAQGPSARNSVASHAVTVDGDQLGFNPVSLFLKESAVKVLFIHHDGAGFADHIEVAAGTTVAQLFEQCLPDRRA